MTLLSSPARARATAAAIALALTAAGLLDQGLRSAPASRAALADTPSGLVWRDPDAPPEPQPSAWRDPDERGL